MSRWVRRAVLALWGVLGGLWVFIMFVSWQFNPTDDVDRGPRGRAFWWSLGLWLLLGVGLFAARRRLRKRER